MDTELILKLLRGSWRGLVAINVSFLILALALGFLLPPVYRVEVLLAPANDESSALAGLMGQFGGLTDLVGISAPQNGNRATYIATLRSRQLARQFIADKNLVPILLPDSRSDPDQKPHNGTANDQPTMWKALRRFDRKVRFVEEDRRTGLVTLAIEWRDSDQAAAWANELVRRCNDTLRHRATIDGKRTIAFLTQEIEKSTQLDVRNLLYRLVEAETKKLAVAVTREDYAFQVVDSAMAPSQPERPKRLLVIAVGLVLGLISSIALLFFKAAGTGQPR
jgi:uncharacterized protein involved in exopolysaccharide biosynthesis